MSGSSAVVGHVFHFDVHIDRPHEREPATCEHEARLLDDVLDATGRMHERAKAAAARPSGVVEPYSRSYVPAIAWIRERTPENGMLQGFNE